MKIGFTGTKEGITVEQERELRLILGSLKVDEAHHGDCVGADASFHDLIVELKPGAEITVHPPKNPKYRAFKKGHKTREPEEYLTRNRRIVAESDIVLATPKRKGRTVAR